MGFPVAFTRSGPSEDHDAVTLRDEVLRLEPLDVANRGKLLEELANDRAALAGRWWLANRD